MKTINHRQGQGLDVAAEHKRGFMGWLWHGDGGGTSSNKENCSDNEREKNALKAKHKTLN